MTDYHARTGPHQGMPVLNGGAPVERAKGAMILMHGRGAGAHDILSLAESFDEPQFFYAAPEAREQTWYPHGFLEPIAKNEPDLSSGLQVIDDLLKDLAAQAMPPEQVILLGFSQGACLVLEYAARTPKRYGGIVGLSGGVIGPAGAQRPGGGSFEGTPVFLGCAEDDPHVPVDRVHETAELLGSLGAEVATRLYPQLGHAVGPDEIAAIKRMIEALEPPR